MNSDSSTPTGAPQNHTPYTQLGKKDKKAGCIIAILILLLVIFIIGTIVFSYHLLTKSDDNDDSLTEIELRDTISKTVSPKIEEDTITTSDKITGDIIAVTETLSEENKIQLWILAKGSKTGRTVSPALNTIYIYEPLEKKILKTISGKFMGSGQNFRFYCYDDKVWFVKSIDSWKDDSDNPLNVFDSKTMNEILNTKSFVEKYDELSVGIQSITFDNRLTGFNITTKDGKKYVYKIKDDKLLTEKEWYDEKNYTNEKIKVYYYSLMPEPHTEGRMLLYRLYVPKSKIAESDFNDSYFWDTFLQNFYRKGAKEIAPDKVYFRGNILYQDKDVILILHNNEADPNSEIKLTCLDTDGEELWVKLQSELFDVKLNSKHKVRRIDNTIIFKAKDMGIIAFDFKTGEKLWTFDY
ncbi:MAG: hypothetical protein ISS16_01700 [Ignavibacteria bacterium]|nr:hypothetical protein [Ignavibacteria bacterium]